MHTHTHTRTWTGISTRHTQQKQETIFTHYPKFFIVASFCSQSLAPPPPPAAGSFGSQADLHTPQKLALHMGKHCEFACEFLFVLMKLF